MKIWIDLPQEEINSLQAMAGRRNLTMTEALRRAINMARFIDEGVQNQDEFLIHCFDGVTRKLVVR